MFDVVIVGAGPAGMTAAIYLKRANKKASIKRAIKGLLTKDGFIRFITGQKEEETVGSNLDKYNEWFVKQVY